MTNTDEEIKIEKQIEELEIQIKKLESGLSLKNDLEENEKLYQYLLQQKQYELVEQRAKEKLADIKKIKELESEILKAEKKLGEIEKIKNLKLQIDSISNKK